MNAEIFENAFMDEVEKLAAGKAPTPPPKVSAKELAASAKAKAAETAKRKGAEAVRGAARGVKDIHKKYPRATSGALGFLIGRLASKDKD